MPAEKKHGNRSCYKRGCRLPECLKADRLWRRDLRARQHRGDPIYDTCPKCGGRFIEGHGFAYHFNRCQEAA